MFELGILEWSYTLVNCSSMWSSIICQSPNAAATEQPKLDHNAVDNATCASGVTLMQPTLMQPKLHHHAVDNAAATEQPKLHQTKQEF